jgi:CRP-like cAMP-binding protein
MRSIGDEGVNNRLLLALPPATLERLDPALHWVELKTGLPIDHVGSAIDNIYFVNAGFVSLVKTMQDGRMVEVGGVGIEGLTDPWSLFGTNAGMFETMVQIPGSAFRIRRDVLMREMKSDQALCELIEAAMNLAIRQLAQTSACNRLHSLGERCCRWLLVARSNVLSDTFPLTHDHLAAMVGAPRSSVSVVAHELKGAGAIDYQRGQVTVLSRRALEARACECYDATRQEIERLYSQAFGAAAMYDFEQT